MCFLLLSLPRPAAEMHSWYAYGTDRQTWRRAPLGSPGQFAALGTTRHPDRSPTQCAMGDLLLAAVVSSGAGPAELTPSFFHGARRHEPVDVNRNHGKQACCSEFSFPLLGDRGREMVSVRQCAFPRACVSLSHPQHKSLLAYAGTYCTSIGHANTYLPKSKSGCSNFSRQSLTIVCSMVE